MARGAPGFEGNSEGECNVPSSAIIDLAIGLIFVFGVTAALASVVTEAMSRLVGLRGAYLLYGLRELLDGGETSTDLDEAKTDYSTMQDLIRLGMGPSAAPSGPGSPPEPFPSATGAVLGSPILRSQGMAGQITSRKLTLTPAKRPGRLPKIKADKKPDKTAGQAGQKAGSVWHQRRSLPSYISATSFAEAVVDLVVPDKTGKAEMTDIQAGVDALPSGMGPLKSSLQALVKNVGDDVDAFRTAVEQWYDDHMDRVSGWYKRRTAKITLAAGGILIVLLNINAITIGRTLYTQSTVSTAISSVAAQGTPCPAKNESLEACLANLQAQLSAAATAGLPIGWGTVRDCTVPGAKCNWWDQRGIFSRHGNSWEQVVLLLLGFLIMIIALVPGAQFWFGLLSKIGSLRSTGPKPANGGT
jgi:hypothetical protein